MAITHGTLSYAAVAACSNHPPETKSMQETGPRGFFSLPRELRDEIYDILHEYEQEAESGGIIFRFPLTHVRNISRRFANEYNMRCPTETRLVISQDGWWWGDFGEVLPVPHHGSHRHLTGVVLDNCLRDQLRKQNLPRRRPRLARLGRGAFITELEFNFDVYDEMRKPFEFWRFSRVGDEYSDWISTFLHHDHHLPKAICGGKVHLRLFFSYPDTFDRLRYLIENESWYNLYCSKISLVLYGAGDGIPSEASLSRARILGVWTRNIGWQVEEENIRSLRAEITASQLAPLGKDDSNIPQAKV